MLVSTITSLGSSDPYNVVVLEEGDISQGGVGDGSINADRGVRLVQLRAHVSSLHNRLRDALVSSFLLKEFVGHIS